MLRVSLVLVMSLWMTSESREIQSVQPVILGGEVISVEESPFIALYTSVLEDKLNGVMQFSCGANIISDRFLLSAAHCYQKKRIDQYVVTGSDKGYLDRSNVNGKVNIEKVIKHPKYNDKTFSHDILVIKLSRSLQFSARVQPIQMEPSGNVIPENSMLQTFGYGRSEFKGSSELRKANVPYVDQYTCRSQFPYTWAQTVDHRTICAGTIRRGGCNGDSGGPLVYNKMLVGITSFGAEKCGTGPVVYTRVGVFRGFIDKTIQSNS